MIGAVQKGIKILKGVYPKHESDPIIHSQLDALIKVWNSNSLKSIFVNDDSVCRHRSSEVGPIVVLLGKKSEKRSIEVQIWVNSSVLMQIYKLQLRQSVS